MKILQNRYDKQKINELEKVTFPGRIITILRESDAEKAVDYLLSQPIIGLDTETKPCFKKGQGMNKVALLQVSSEDTCFLFRLCRFGMTESIVRLLSDTRTIKVGLSWQDDTRQLQQRRKYKSGTFVELQKEVKKMGVDDMSLQKLYANFFGRKISKSQQLSNWEADTLTPAQQEYAAIDAWACVHLYKEIQRLKETGDYIIDWGEEE